MPVELRKRKAPAAPPAAAPPAKKTSSVKSALSKAKAKVTNGTSASSKVIVGQTVSLQDFGGEVETHDGHKTTLQKLVGESKGGVVLFTYPKASTPGCTTQACLFRDDYTPLTATGFSIYGLSTDSPKANTTFKTKQNLPYTLLCDPNASLIGAIGLKKPPKGTTRGVFVVNKEGKVLAAEAGGPAATVEVVRKLVSSSNGVSEKTPAVKEPTVEDKKQAEVAADVANTAANLDKDALKA